MSIILILKVRHRPSSEEHPLVARSVSSLRAGPEEFVVARPTPRRRRKCNFMQNKKHKIIFDFQLISGYLPLRPRLSPEGLLSRGEWTAAIKIDENSQTSATGILELLYTSVSPVSTLTTILHVYVSVTIASRSLRSAFTMCARCAAHTFDDSLRLRNASVTGL